MLENENCTGHHLEPLIMIPVRLRGFDSGTDCHIHMGRWALTVCTNSFQLTPYGRPSSVTLRLPLHRDSPYSRPQHAPIVFICHTCADGCTATPDEHLAPQWVAVLLCGCFRMNQSHAFDGSMYGPRPGVVMVLVAVPTE
jgi:hypothetical protein